MRSSNARLTSVQFVNNLERPGSHSEYYSEVLTQLLGATVLSQPAFAHSRNVYGEWEEVAKHLLCVSERAARFAAAFEAGKEAQFAAMLHDSGKYGERFQARLRGETKNVDHWSIGARLACVEQKWNGWAAALAIEGHHTGLLWGTGSDLQHRLQPSETWSVTNVSELRARLEREVLWGSASFSSIAFPPGGNLSVMLSVRMLFSTLVDADFLATEEHFQGTARPEAPELDAVEVEALVEAALTKLADVSGVDYDVRQLRQDVGAACRAAAEHEPGLFTLAAPTGSGKTLALLLFAARHARLNSLRRIVVALPYLTITDQTVKTYSGVLAPWLSSLPAGTGLLEHHSLAGTRDVDGGISDLDRTREQLAENWDAPIVVTTTVQLLESLFANRPGACRKLHRLARSVILLDEVQTIPAKLAVPTLAALSHLAARFHTTIVMATATQPAFGELDEAVRQQAVSGWRPTEICGSTHALYRRVRRYRIEWPAREGETSDEALIAKISEAAAQASVLVIANLKRQALRWHRLLANQSLARLNHLSTNMTPAHRRRVLEDWERPEATQRPGQVLVATQCVEAGVDLDFPAVFRAFGPLDSMAQAAGRVNRHGRLAEGRLVVALPHEEGRSYPDGTYQQAADEALGLLRQRDWPEDLEDPALFEEYFRKLYRTRGTAGLDREFEEALSTFDFPRVAELFRLIEAHDVINVVCPDGDDFYAQALDARVTADWVRRARLHAVNIFRPPADSEAWRALSEVPLFGRNGERLESDWFVLTDRSRYNNASFGLEQWGSGVTIA